MGNINRATTDVVKELNDLHIQLKTLAGAKILGEVTNNSYRTIKKGSESLDLEISLGIPNSMDKKYLVEAFSRFSVSSSAYDISPT